MVIRAVGKNHQNYCVYKFVDNVLSDDFPSLISTGTSYVEAIQTYLGQVDIPVDTKDENQERLIAQLKDASDQVSKELKDVKKAYMDTLGNLKMKYDPQQRLLTRQGPDYIDPMTGEHTSLNDYIKVRLRETF